MADLAIDHLSRRERFLLTLVYSSIRPVVGEAAAVEDINYIVGKVDSLEAGSLEMEMNARRYEKLRGAMEITRNKGCPSVMSLMVRTEASCRSNTGFVDKAVDAMHATQQPTQRAEAE